MKKFFELSEQEQYDVMFDDDMMNFAYMDKEFGSQYSITHLDNLRRLIEKALAKNIAIPQKVLDFMILS
mgnify:FL=1